MNYAIKINKYDFYIKNVKYDMKNIKELSAIGAGLTRDIYEAMEFKDFSDAKDFIEKTLKSSSKKYTIVRFIDRSN